MTEYDVIGRGLLVRWVRATWAGWLLGVPLIIVLALAGEAAGIGGAQVLVGAGIGLGVGLMQRRVIRGLLTKPGLWLWSCTVGLALPFLVADIATAAGWDFVYSLPVSVAWGGLVVGGWQALILRSRFPATGWWVMGSAAGWSMAAGMAAAADALTRAK